MLEIKTIKVSPVNLAIIKKLLWRKRHEKSKTREDSATLFRCQTKKLLI